MCCKIGILFQVKIMFDNMFAQKYIDSQVFIWFQSTPLLLQIYFFISHYLKQ